MRIEQETKLDYKDVLFRPKRSTLTSRSEVDLMREFTFPNAETATWKGVPIVAANMDTVGTFETAKALAGHHMLTCMSKHFDLKKWLHKMNGYGVYKSPEQRKGTVWEHDPDSRCSHNRIYEHMAVSCGIKDEDLDYLDSILRMPSLVGSEMCIRDSGYSERFSAFLKSVRDKYPTKTIIAGNVVTADMTQELILSGADIVKVGIGPGSVCTTRIQTGVGYPQLSAGIECADAAHGLGAHIIADGGCTCPGDVAKAFGGGGDFVMLGGMLAGHDEGDGKIIKVNGNKFIEFYGSSSEEANEKHYGGLANYRSSEGKKVKIQMKNSLDSTIRDILGGVRSSCTYVGASSLKQLSKCTTFVRVNNQYNDTFGKV